MSGWTEEGLTRAWRALARQEAAEDWRFVHLTAMGAISVEAGCHFPLGREALIVSFPGSSPVNAARLPEGKGFDVTSIEGQTVFAGKTAIALVRRPEGSPDIFAIMVVDVLRTLEPTVANASKDVMEAFLEGLERARQAGLDLARIASVASFFVSRVDTEVDARLDKIGAAAAAALRGRAAIANARLAYQRYERMLASPRWAALAAAGARPQRPLWASTSVKDPAYSDTMYVTKLVAPGVVNTMPEATMKAVADHGEITGDTIKPNIADAAQVFTNLQAVGIDMADVFSVLETEGVDKFIVAWEELLATIQTALESRGETAVS